MSESPEIDGQWMDLEEALQKTIGQFFGSFSSWMRER